MNPGWYPDPSSGWQRYWDGAQWSQIPPPPQQQPPIVINNTVAAAPVFVRRRSHPVLAVFGGLMLFGMALSHWQVFLFLAVLVVLGCVWHFSYKRTERQAQIAARADQAYLNDPSGFLYPPTVFDQPKNRHEK